jgi:hypothetical protein
MIAWLKSLLGISEAVALKLEIAKKERKLMELAQDPNCTPELAEAATLYFTGGTVVKKKEAAK